MQRSHPPLLARLAAGAALLAVPASAPAAEPLTIPAIMARDWIGTPPERPYWSEDGKSVYFERRRPGSELTDLYRVEVGSGVTTRIEESARGMAEAPGGVLSRDRRRRLFLRRGDLFLAGPGRGKMRQLTRTDAEESAPLFLAGERRAAFRQGNRFYALDLEEGTLAELADLRLEEDPAPAPAAGFLGEQQRRLFASVRDAVARREEAAEADRRSRAEDPTRAPAPWYLGKDQELLEAALAPSGRHVVVVLGPKRGEREAEPDGAPGGVEESMPVWVTESGYLEVRKVRPKVGTGEATTPTVALLDLATRERRDLDLALLPGAQEDPLASLRAAARAAQAASHATQEPAKEPGKAAQAEPAQSSPERALRLDALAWNEAGTLLALQVTAHDHKDRWLALVDPATGALTPVDRQRDAAWVGWRFDDFGWMRDGASLWFLSEESGFSHLYVAGAGSRRQLTRGPFEVDRPQLARDGASFLVEANREAPGIVEIYRVSAADGAMTRLTTFGGHARALPSPDEKQLLLTLSSVTGPPELYVQPGRPAAAAKRLTTTVSPEFAAVDWVRPEVLPIPSRHGAGEIWARLYTPPGWSETGRYPAVLFVHGAGYLQNAHQGWSSYFREFMFHTLLARRGYVVLDLDYRASAGYGRDWRTAIYRQMGTPELEDLEDGVAWLVEQKRVDPARIGVYGGSYGGFLTLMALFKRPELFAAGAALRPVTDWAHYNHGYTSAILNTPEVDPEAYRASSPIELAEGLARPLLLCHGMVDDNVVFQDTVRLVQRLIELGKTELFETAIYPVEPHAFREPASWVDEYTRIWRLFERELW